jgi:hypothetical protein
VVDFLEESGFNRFSFIQTVFNSPDQVEAIEPVRKVYDSGSFVVVKAVKQDAGPRPSRSRTDKHRLLNSDASLSRSNDGKTG